MQPDAVTLHVVRKMAALLALSGLVTPGVIAIAMTAHLASHHDHDEGRDRRRTTSSLIWHGHAHEDGMPGHGHPLTLADAHPFQTVRPKVIPLQPYASVLGGHSSPRCARIAEAGRAGQLDLVGLGPPSLARLSILRI